MIVLSEQYGYKDPKPHTVDISGFYDLFTESTYLKQFKGRKSDNLCFQLLYEQHEDHSSCRFETSFYIGTDWIIKNKLPIHVHPKLNSDHSELNYLKMLSDAMKHIESTEHLEHLFEIDFESSLIEIDQSKDLLSPLLVVQFLHLLKRIVQKGLKKTYYKVERNLNSKVKGKILINKTIKNNLFRNKPQYTVCSYQEFGYNGIENQILKKALLFVINIIEKIRGIDTKDLYRIYHYITPAFTSVDADIESKTLKQFKPNPLYKEYEQAIKLAQLILKKYGYNITNVNSSKVKTPPYWINMSKLFELYVFSRLKEVFPQRGEINYQKTIFYRELDYLLKSKDDKYKMVIDAKYKPQYENSMISIEDIRQVSAYARMEKVYSALGVANENNIDCLIIYPNQNIDRDNFLDIDFKDENLKEREYVNFYKIGIALPRINPFTKGTVSKSEILPEISF